MVMNNVTTYCAQTFSDDNPRGEDQLDLESPMYAIADCLALEDLSPPFVVGIVGGWGSGKSFAMKLIERRLGQISMLSLSERKCYKDGKKSPYVGHIYPIHFNAWTFSKKEIWSSLMYRIFFDLNECLSVEEKLRNAFGDPLQGFDLMSMVDNLSSSQMLNLPKHLEEIAQKKKGDDFKKLLQNIETDFGSGDAKKAFVRVLNHRSKIDAKELKELNRKLDQKKKVTKNQKLFSFLKQSTEEIFLDELKNFRQQNPKYDVMGDHIDEFLNSLGLVKRNSMLFVAGLGQIRERLSIFWVCVFVIAMVSTIYISIQFPRYKDEAIQTTIIAPIATILHQIYASMEKAKKNLKGWDAVPHAIEAAQKTQEKMIEGFEDKETISEIQKRIETIKKRKWLFEGDSVLDVVGKQLESKSYESKLGVVHKAQNDIKALSNSFLCRDDVELSQQMEEDSEDLPFPRGKPRIVLIVEDLDRCPPDIVVEVLDALHVLLDKSKLFVAVLSIDVKYVARCLEAKYAGVLKDGDAPSGKEYIEKMIQIPFSCGKMNTSYLKRFFSSQMKIMHGREEQSPSLHDSRRTSFFSSFEGKSVYESAKGENGNSDSFEKGGIMLKSEGKKSITSKMNNDLLERDSSYFTESQLDAITTAGQIVYIKPRAGKCLLNIYKVLHLLWFRQENEPDIHIQIALLVLIASALKYPKFMGEVLADLEDAFLDQCDELIQRKSKKRSAHQANTNRVSSKTLREVICKNHHYTNFPLKLQSIFNRTRFDQIQMSDIGAANIRLVRSFSFVGGDQ